MAIGAALIAFCLGAWGPRFLCRGLTLLMLATVATGLAATIDASREASAHGYRFGYSAASVIKGLVLQIVFMLSVYGMAALARRLVVVISRRLRRSPVVEGS